MIREFLDHLASVEKTMLNGQLAIAYEKLGMLRQQVAFEVNNTYGVCNSMEGIQGLMEVIQACDSLRSQMLRSMARML
ncbi:MAG: hypothetical protein JW801_10295 [Bacteroidales bacterium]|nr:hypothetical protein [Bacteroidales bacterium]